MKLFSVSVHLSGFNALYDPVSSCVCEHTDSEHILFLLLKGLQQQQVVLQNANSKNQEKENSLDFQAIFQSVVFSTLPCLRYEFLSNVLLGLRKKKSVGGKTC